MRLTFITTGYQVNISIFKPIEVKSKAFSQVSDHFGEVARIYCFFVIYISFRRIPNSSLGSQDGEGYEPQYFIDEHEQWQKQVILCLQ